MAGPGPTRQAVGLPPQETFFLSLPSGFHPSSATGVPGVGVRGRAGGVPPSPLRTTEGKRLVQAEADLCQEPGLLNFQASAMVLK